MPTTTLSAFPEVLTAGDPQPAGSDVPDLYGWLVGSWDADAVDHLADGTTRRQSAEIHFARVLEGRAIQDLWIVPARADRSAVPGPGNRFGTTLRTWDPAIAAWRIVWINPVTGAENRLVGRQVGDAIVQTGADEAGRLMRWTLAPLTTPAPTPASSRHDGFHWRGDRSADGGLTWVCETEFFARRRS